MKAKEGLHPQVETPYSNTAPGILCPTSSLLHNIHTSQRRLLPKSRLSTTNEPPAEEAHEAAHDGDDCNRYACDRARAEVRTSGHARLALQPVPVAARLAHVVCSAWTEFTFSPEEASSYQSKLREI